MVKAVTDPKPAPSYNGRHAEVYDLLYADKPYKAEADFVHRCLQTFRIGSVKHVLELACGTGSHALALERHGYRIIATDYSEDMLRVGRAKAASEDSSVEFRWQDMRTLDVPEAPFDAIISLFDSIGYVATDEALQRVLSNVRRHLGKEGLFVFEFWHAAAMLRNYEPVRVRRSSTPEGELLRISTTTLERDAGLAHVAYSIYELHNDGKYSVTGETQTNRYFLVQEMAKLLDCAGLVPVHWFGGFQVDSPITKDTWHIIGVAKPAGTWNTRGRTS
jgi:SAM-dependent methyltransferase